MPIYLKGTIVKVLVAASPSLYPSPIPCREGERVWLVDPCGKRGCTCADTFTGLETDGLTEVAVVVDEPDLTPDAFRKWFWRVHRERLGCTCALREHMPDELLSFASSLPVGTLVERFGRRVRPISD